MNDQFNATLVNREDIAENLLIFHVKPDSGVPDFIPGQYVALGLMPEDPRLSSLPPETAEPREGKLIKRTYSIGSSPNSKDSYEFYLAVVAEGSLSARLACLQEGARLYCAPKVTGKFTLDPIPNQGNIIMVATGTGVAPYLSMLRTASTWERGGDIKLVYGIRYTQDIAYLKELESLSQEHSNFSYHITVSRPDSEWAGEKGYVQNLFIDNKISLDASKDHLMLCGNPAMITDMQELLEERGFVVHSRKQAGNIHLEKYW